MEFLFCAKYSLDTLCPVFPIIIIVGGHDEET